MRKGTARKTITFSELQRLTVCNSPKLPKQVEFRGVPKGGKKEVVRYMQYVGIGWIDIQPCNVKNPALVVEDAS